MIVVCLFWAEKEKKKNCVKINKLIKHTNEILDKHYYYENGQIRSSISFHSTKQCYAGRSIVFGSDAHDVTCVTLLSKAHHKNVSHEFICETSHVLLAGVSGGFSPGTPVFAPPTD